MNARGVFLCAPMSATPLLPPLSFLTSTVSVSVFLGCCCLLRLSVLPWNMKQANARRRKSCEKRKQKKRRRKTRIWNMRKIKLLTKIIYVMVCSKCVCGGYVCVGLSCWLRWLLGHFSLARARLKIYATLWTAVVLYILTRKGGREWHRVKERSIKREKGRLILKWSWKLLVILISNNIICKLAKLT